MTALVNFPQRHLGHKRWPWVRAQASATSISACPDTLREDKDCRVQELRPRFTKVLSNRRSYLGRSRKVGKLSSWKKPDDEVADITIEE